MPGEGDDLNQSLERAGRIADFFELAELMCLDAEARDESCGAHFREEHQTADGEALRDDQQFAHVAVWEYRGDPPESFFTRERGGAHALSNGNVLITESAHGRVFEVTRQGEIVWEFWNPDFSAEGPRRQIYRMYRVPHAVYSDWANSR